MIIYIVKVFIETIFRWYIKLKEFAVALFTFHNKYVRGENQFGPSQNK